MPATLHVPSTGTLQLLLACDIEQVRPTSLAAREFLSAQGLSDEELMACELSLVEACNNAVNYVNPSRQFDPIEIDLSCDDSIIEIRIHDHTDGFELPKNAELVGSERETGRGIFLIQSLMDEVRYAIGIGENRMTLRKFRSGSQTKEIFSDKIAALNARIVEGEQIINDMAEELSSCYESLSAIFRNGAELGKTDNLQKFSRSLCDDLLKITLSDWFLLRIVPQNESALTAFAISTPDLRLPPISIAASATKVSAELKAAFYRKDVLFDAQNLLDKNDPLQAMPPAGVGLVHPFYFAEALIGTLTLGKAVGQPAFTAAHVNVLHTFADFLGIQIVNSRLRDEQINHRLFTRELEIAHGIQRALLPKQLPQLQNFGLAGYCQSARHVGGDFYDVVEINDHSALLVVADVMGKGVPAAMFAAVLRSVLRGAPELTSQPAALMGRVNRLLFEELSDVEMFITVQLAFIDVQAREVIVASAGHCPALLFSCQTSVPKLISPEGMPLGILRDTAYAEIKEPLPHKSRLLLYTDGLPEARNAADQFFGHERLETWMRQSAAALGKAEDLKTSLIAELSSFQEHATPRDDQTFLVLAEENL